VGAAVIVALFDIFKGALAVILARLVFDDALTPALCGLLAVLGTTSACSCGSGAARAWPRRSERSSRSTRSSGWARWPWASSASS
jgi:hypothetical protein